MKSLSIVREGETIFECIDAWYVPRVGEPIALAKWDTVYTVVSVFTVFGKSHNVETVIINVKIKNA